MNSHSPSRRGAGVLGGIGGDAIGIRLNSPHADSGKWAIGAGPDGRNGLGWWNADVAISGALSLSSMMDWSQIATDLKPDGSLRDIYILGTSIDDWALIWNVLTASNRLAFDVDGIARTPPADVREAFALHASHSVTACYRLGKQRLNCHFFVEEEVEFDLDPKDVDGLGEAERLGQFLVDLGRMTSKEVRLTAEDEREAVIARYSPTSDSVVWSAVL